MAYYHEIEESRIERMKTMLDCEMTNNNTGIHYLERVIEAMESFNGKTFNKRVETHLNKFFGVIYGTETSHGRTYPKVSAWLSTSYSTTRLGINGSFVEWSSYEKKIQTRKHHRVVELHVDSVEGVTEQAQNKIAYLKESNEKIKANKRTLKSKVAKYNKLTAEVMKFNEDISYVLSDELRIK